MGALMSTVKDGRVTEVKVSSPDKKANNSDFENKYKDILNKHGYYTISVDPIEFSNYLELNKDYVNIENFTEIVSNDSKAKKPELKSISVGKATGVARAVGTTRAVGVSRSSNKIFKMLKKENLQKFNDQGSLFIFIGSLSGFYSIVKPDDEKKIKVNQIKILLPKVLLVKGESDKFIDLLASRQPKKNKEKIELVKKVLQHLQKQENSEVIISNMIGILIKASVFMYSAEQNKSNKEKIMLSLVKEVIKIIPNNKCILESKSVKFLNIEPALCDSSIFVKQESKKDCPSCPENSCPVSETQEENPEKSDSTVWVFTTVMFVIISVIFAVLYFTKSSSK